MYVLVVLFRSIAPAETISSRNLIMYFELNISLTPRASECAPEVFDRMPPHVFALYGTEVSVDVYNIPLQGMVVIT